MPLLILGIIATIVAVIIFFVKEIEVTQNRKVETINIRKFCFIPLGLAILLTFLASFRVIDAGTVSIPVAFGTVGEPINEGSTFVAPWTGLQSLSIRTQEYTMTVATAEGAVKGDDSVTVNGSDGASAQVDSTLLFHLDKGNASKLYREVGVNYVDVLVRPKTRECIRDAGPKQTTVELVTSKRDQFTQSAEDCIRAALEPRGLTVEDLQVRAIRASQNIQGAIDAKVAAQQDAEKKQFELAAARQDAEIQRTRNLALSDGQQIVKCGGKVVSDDNGGTKVVPLSGEECQNQLTPEYLQWYYIDMMKQIVSSPNHDTVIIPSNMTPPQVLVQPQK